MIHPETSFIRKDSRSCLIEDIDGKSAASPPPFQLVHGKVPEPYQVAVSSRENLETVGIEGFERTLTNTTLVSSLGSGSSQPSISNGASAGNITSQYEQVTRRYKPTEFSSSSPKIPNRHTRGGSASGGTATVAHHNMPLRKTVSGPMRGKPHHPGPFRRHMSSIDDKFAEGTDEDYSHLNHNLPSTPSSVFTPTKKQSSSSFVMMTPSPIVTTSQTAQPPPQHIQHQLPRPDSTNRAKRNSVTNYSRSPPSPTDSHDSTGLAMRNFQTFTPTSEGPPPYESESSPYSPSGSSLLENGAYEGVVYPQQQPQQPLQLETAAEHQRRLELEQCDESLGNNQQPWYHNASDFSLNNNQPDDGVADSIHPQQQRGRLNSNITPYSQVSNTEIDSRRMEENVRAGLPPHSTNPMFSISSNIPMGFSPPRHINSIQHTVVV